VEPDKKYVSNEDIQVLCSNICNQLKQDDFVPDIIVGLSRGGLIPGVMISHYLDVKFMPLSWSTRDHAMRTSDAALAEDALTQKILIVDDICDTGRTFSEIKENWQSCVRDTIPWHTTVRFASLHFRNGANTNVEYRGETVNGPEWIVYPWEIWNGN
jgi:hypothetical protein